MEDYVNIPRSLREEHTIIKHLNASTRDQYERENQIENIKMVNQNLAQIIMKEKKVKEI